MEINLLTRIINYIMKFLNRNIFFLYYQFLAIRKAKSVYDELLSDKKEKIKVHYAEIPLEVSNIYYDSVRTDDGELYFGKINDQVFGDIKSIAYTQFIFETWIRSIHYQLPREGTKIITDQMTPQFLIQQRYIMKFSNQ